MSRGSEKQSDRELASGVARTRAQGATVQISPIRPVLPQHACRRPQHLLSTPSRLAIDTADLRSRGGSAIVRCRRRRVRPDQPLPPFIPTPVTVTKPARVQCWSILDRLNPRPTRMASVRRLTAILAADVAGYSRLMGADEEGTHERLRAHLRELIEPKIAEHHGCV